MHRISRCACASARPEHKPRVPEPPPEVRSIPMHQIIYIVGAIVLIIALLSFVGLR